MADISLTVKARKKGIKGTVTIPSQVKIKGVTYKVTSVGASAFKNNTKITKVIIGKNITKIGINAFKGIYSKAVIKVPKSRLKYYTKLLKKRGISSKARIKK